MPVDAPDSRLHESKADLADLSNSLHDFDRIDPGLFKAAWARYVKLLASSGKYLFEEKNKSKERFCELLHLQISVSNKLCKILSETDEKTFTEYSRFMGDIHRLGAEGLSGDADIVESQNSLAAYFGITLSSQSRSSGADKGASGEAPGGKAGNKELMAFLEAQNSAQSQPQSNYLNIKSYLFDDTPQEKQSESLQGFPKSSKMNIEGPSPQKNGPPLGFFVPPMAERAPETRHSEGGVIGSPGPHAAKPRGFAIGKNLKQKFK